ncbi:hypothetical protein HPP92_001867 [Vanilla planifolia]|uniref:Anaphase-promoting complex subunit 5 n=1 Tax=Vanilla planifolia TaxID=51239 RepID=A0A835RZ19_VANPL|nr:hypothetical protein HPP92_001867 [Vanilla planifolia]
MVIILLLWKICTVTSITGNEGLFNRSSASPPDVYVGRYETALLCLGTMHSYFGHPKKALEALTEALRLSQLSNDDACLAYTLAAICNLLSDAGIANTSGMLGSQDSLENSMSLGAPLSTQQQLLVLLKRSLKRADSLKLINLMAFNRLALSKFDLKPNPIPGSVSQLSGSSYLLRATSWELYGSVKGLCKNDRFCCVLQQSMKDCVRYENAPLVRLNALVYAICFANSARLFILEEEPPCSLYVKSLLVAKTGLKREPEEGLDFLTLFYENLQQEAFAALKLAEKKFSPVSKSRIQLLKLQLLHERALHRGKLKSAKLACEKIGVLASSTSGVDMDIKVEESLRHARTLLAANQYSKAAAVAHSLYCMCYKFNMQVENATVLLLLAEIFKKSGNAVLAVQYVLAKAFYLIAMIHNHLGEMEAREEAAASFKIHVTALENPSVEDDPLLYGI